ncbi:MAG: radical SAM protein [Lentisphaeria bacterium]|nr:radical SAM protein [Lentisphaeria bacterium]
MSTFNHTTRVFRPPAEGNSLILQLATGCPHNTCRFCGMYKGIPYHEPDVDDMIATIRDAARRFPEERRLFLADGDIMSLPFEKLRAVFTACCDFFPRVSRISLYANGSSLAEKTPDQFRALRALKLAIAYVGLETGDDTLLRAVGKHETAAAAVQGVRDLQETGAKASVMVLLGLGGKAGSKTHITKTIDVVNRMRPRLLSALRLVDVPGLTMHEEYETISEYDSIRELRDLIAGLNLPGTVFTANHVSIPFPVKGRLPKDKNALTDALSRLMTTGCLDTRGPGRLPGYL